MSGKIVFTFLEEPRGKEYWELIDYAILQCRYFILVDLFTKLSSKGTKTLEKLLPFLKIKELKSEWPGTRILNKNVAVYTYELNQESAEIIKNEVNGLFQWQSPAFPDDLCFLRKDKSPWLIDTAHEADAYFIFTKDDLDKMILASPHFWRKVIRDEKQPYEFSNHFEE